MSITIESENQLNLVDALNQAITSQVQQDNIGLYHQIMEIIEPALFKTVMENCRYNQSKAARLLGITRRTLYLKLNYYFGDKYLKQKKESQ